MLSQLLLDRTYLLRQLVTNFVLPQHGSLVSSLLLELKSISEVFNVLLQFANVLLPYSC